MRQQRTERSRTKEGDADGDADDEAGVLPRFARLNRGAELKRALRGEDGHHRAPAGELSRAASVQRGRAGDEAGWLCES